MPTATDVSIQPYRPEHAAAWRSLNEDWLLAGGYALEAKDQLVLSDPQGVILDRGGHIFIAERDGAPVGCCSLMAMADGGYEVGKMAVTGAANLVVAIQFPQLWPAFLAIFPTASKLGLFAVQYAFMRRITIRSLRAQRAFARTA